MHVVLDDPTVTSIFTSALSGFTTQILAVAAIALGIGVTMLVLKRGWGTTKTVTK